MKPSNFCGKSLVSNLPLLSIENRSHVRSRITRELPWNLDYRFSVEPGYSIFIHRSLENNGFWDQLSTRLLATLIITGTSDRSGVTDRSYRGIDDSFMVQRMPVFLIFSFFFFSWRRIFNSEGRSELFFVSRSFNVRDVLDGSWFYHELR